MLAVGIVGCGAIGSGLARAVERRFASQARIAALTDVNPAQAQRLQQSLRRHPPIVSLPELIRRSQLVIEAASASASAPVALAALAAHRDVMVMSAGGLLAAWSAVQRSAARSRGRLLVPSGALAGLDGVKALALGPLRRVRLTTSKPPRALASAPWVAAKRLRLDGLRRARVLFNGSPREVVRAFPHNTNVAATLLLALLSAGARMSAASVRVRVVADPTLRLNRHALEIVGDCGSIAVRIESRPSAENPKTSELAIRSAIAALQALLAPIRIGT